MSRDDVFPVTEASNTVATAFVTARNIAAAPISFSSSMIITSALALALACAFQSKIDHFPDFVAVVWAASMSSVRVHKHDIPHTTMNLQWLSKVRQLRFIDVFITGTGRAFLCYFCKQTDVVKDRCQR